MPPEFNLRVLAPYFLNQELADMIVENRNKTSMRGAANRAMVDKAGLNGNEYEELPEEVKAATRFIPDDPYLWEHGPPTLQAPDIWNMGIMLLQVHEEKYEGLALTWILCEVVRRAQGPKLSHVTGH